MTVSRVLASFSDSSVGSALAWLCLKVSKAMQVGLTSPKDPVELIKTLPFRNSRKSLLCRPG